MPVSSCGNARIVLQRDRAIFHVFFRTVFFLLVLTWVALPFLAKTLYCGQSRRKL